MTEGAGHADQVGRFDTVGCLEVPLGTAVALPGLEFEGWVLELPQPDNAGRFAVGGDVGISSGLLRLTGLVHTVGVAEPLVEPEAVLVSFGRGPAIGLVDQAESLESRLSVARVEQAVILDRDANLTAELRPETEELLVPSRPEDPSIAAPALSGGVVLGPSSIVGVAIGPAFFIICRLDRARWGEQGKHDSGSQDDEIPHRELSP